MIREAIDAIGPRTTNVELRDWILERHPSTNPLTVQAQIIICTVNHDSRVAYPENRKPRQAVDPRYDFLYRPGRGQIELYDPVRHGRWGIVERENGRLAISLMDEDATEPAPETPVAADSTAPVGGRTFAVEDHLRDYLARNLEAIEAGLQVYIDDAGNRGVEYATPVGRIDLLAVDSAGCFVVLELKVGRGSDAVCGQLLRYKGWVTQHMAQGGRVRGMIIAESISERIHYAMTGIPDVELKEYEMHVSVRPAVHAP